MAGYTHYLENKVLDHVFRNTTYTPAATMYVALFTAAPTDNYTSGSPDGTECTGGSYARTSAAFAAASGGSTSNSGAVTFPTSTATWGGSVTHFGVFDAATNGNLLGWAALSLSRTVDAAGITLSFGSGELVITQD